MVEDKAAAWRMPAEWEPHERCWMAWPSRPETWQNGLDSARRALARVVLAIAAHERVSLVVRAEDADEARRLTAGVAEILVSELDDGWTRDTGPTFLVDGTGGLAGVDWGFNAWGLAFEGFARDARLARVILERAGARRIVGPQILEGGSIHVDGQGTLLTTEPCVAAQILGAAFPGRQVVIVPGDGISDGGGDIHCIAQQQPKA